MVQPTLLLSVRTCRLVHGAEHLQSSHAAGLKGNADARHEKYRSSHIGFFSLDQGLWGDGC